MGNTTPTQPTFTTLDSRTELLTRLSHGDAAILWARHCEQCSTHVIFVMRSEHWEQWVDHLHLNPSKSHYIFIILIVIPLIIIVIFIIKHHHPHNHYLQSSSIYKNNSNNGNNNSKNNLIILFISSPSVIQHYTNCLIQISIIIIIIVLLCLLLFITSLFRPFSPPPSPHSILLIPLSSVPNRSDTLEPSWWCWTL